MAATGGGKIRTRRYHIVSKPYGKGKQPGLISRVTDTVKSIVPSWLQKYFNNGEGAEGGEIHVQVEQNNVPTPPNGNQEPAPLPDGRDSPEPSTSNAEPSTSKASLNFQDVLSRPPLNRSHLHFPSLDGSPALGGSLFSQPSTSTAPFPASPFAVSSSFSLVKEIKDSSSQHEDDNISTTSGFSSRASDKDVPTSKTAPLLWSPEAERTQSGSQPAHASLKKPAFNLSVFGTSSSSVMNSSVLNSSQLGDSPFYPGKTTYGGASAAKTARSRPGTPYQAPVRRQIKAKPAGAQPCGVTSATARRILQSLERMSSPLADAKRIPSTVSSPLSASLNHTDLDASNFQSKRKKLEPAVPPVQKLVIPAAAAVSGNRSMSFRPSLTPGSMSRVVEKGSKETPVRRSPHIPDAIPAATPSTSSLSYPLSSTPAASITGAGGGKMKRERSIRPSTKRPDDEVAEVLDLPAVSLPISNFKLPTFSFSSPPPASTLTPSTMAKPLVSDRAADSKGTTTMSTPVSVSFTFSSPIVKATAASPMSFSSSPGFTFSAPTMKTTTSMSNGKLTPAIPTLKTVSESNDEFDGPFKPAKALKQGSVLDILKGPGFASPARNSSETDPAKSTRSTTVHTPLTSLAGFGEKFKPAAGSWNCGTCLLQNKSSDKKCVACQAPQPSTDSSSKSDSKPGKAPAASHSSLFAPPAEGWDCDTCMVKNKPEVVKCVACDTAKPGTGVKPALTRPPVSEVSSAPSASSTAATNSTTTTTTTTSGLLSFADKFKKPEGSWDCDVCMVQNKAQDVTCVACQSAKPGAAAPSSQAPSSLPPASTPASSAPLLGFGDQFKKPEGSWECDVCCVQNKAQDSQCVACQSAKPGAKVETKGIGPPSSSTNSTSTAFKFGTSNSSNSGSGELKFGGTFSNSTSTVSFKFGNASSDTAAPSAGFKFGGSSSDSSSQGFKFGGASSEHTSTSSSEGFKFGGSSDGFKLGAASTSESTSEEKKTELPNSGAGFKFGGGSASFGSDFKFGAPSTSESKNEEKKTEPQNSGAGFKFGGSSASFGSGPKFGAASTSESTSEEKKSESQNSGAGFKFGGSSASIGSSSISTATATTASGGFAFGLSKPEEKTGSNLSFSLAAPKAKADKEDPLPSTEAASATANAAPIFNTAELFVDGAQQKTSTTTFMFGKPEEKKDTSTPSTGFLFSAAKEADKPAPSVGFSFSKPDPSKELSKPTFTFGKPAEPTETTKQTFGFGQNATDNTATKPAFSFMGSSSTTPASSSLAPSVFVTPSSSSLAPTPAPTSTFVFGQSSSTDAPSKTFMFGQQQETQPSSAEPAAANNPVPTFVFGSVSNSNASPFSFGGAASTPASTAPAPSAAPFGFTATTSASGFSSGQTPAFGSSQSTVPAFGSAASSFTATASATPAFGTKPSAPSVFGQQPNSTPAFGSSAASSGQGGFQFGGATAFGASGSNNSSVFTFGGGSGGTASPASTPAMPAQPAAPGAGFSFSQPPAFNIGSAKSSNPAPTGQHNIAGRKIKTAVRRRK
ncbi:nuclear pore complex protein Nup153 isoform X2 [Hemibagrus wyckioides]|uniref:nuclear pore complex protein Nup153 isoform X2 n=1 Tax=Hemibagrus wyckioides TaxID=337641 RepID=UPI00266C15D2|nr:nuclear pore complex protein Nup153 isoform X2 [Hemibagrus wyckioides]